jgi:phospholipid/cholesterol/gamma-HCH transport system permease protein
VFQVITDIGKQVHSTILRLGSYTIFVGHGLARGFVPPVSWHRFLQQVEFVGNRSFWIILLAGAMVGGIFGFQLGEIFRIFGAESMIGASTAFALSRELGPVIGAFLVTARAGSAMAAEIATMRVNEQIDAMRVMAVNPYAYLIAPRLLATMIVMPFLTVFFTLAGVLTSFFIGVAFYRIDVADFMSKIEWVVTGNDLSLGMQKAALFGFVFASISCFQGFTARGGAKGVGRATTTAVVTSYVSILVLDFFMTYLQYKGFDIFIF